MDAWAGVLGLTGWYGWRKTEPGFRICAASETRYHFSAAGAVWMRSPRELLRGPLDPAGGRALTVRRKGGLLLLRSSIKPGVYGKRRPTDRHPAMLRGLAMFRPSRSSILLYANLLAHLCLYTPALAQAPGAPTPQPPTQPSTTGQTPTQPSTPAIAPPTNLDLLKLQHQLEIESHKLRAQMTLQVERTSSELELLRGELGRARWFFTLAAIILALFAVGGVTIGWVISFRAEGRAMQMHELSVSSQTSARLQAEQTHASVLEASQRTLTLVNDTLELAKEANAAAARTMRLKAEQSLEEIDSHARDVLISPLQGNDFKVVVENAGLRSSLREAASDLLSIEGYLQLQGIDFTPVCYFLKGMERHLRQEPRVAIRNLREAAQRSRDRDLTAFALYWVGYELNNLGQFRAAADTFRRALDGEVPSNPRYFELKRIELESRFFERAAELGKEKRELGDAEIEGATQDLVHQLRDLIDGVPQSAEFRGVREGTHRTWGNVLSWAGRNAASAGSRESSFREAMNQFAAAGSRLYSVFGLLEAKQALWRLTKASGCEVNPSDYEQVIKEAYDQLSIRTEPRTLALLNETRLIAHYRREGSAALASVYRELMTALNAVDPTITVYSQLDKRNIPWDQFQEEVRTLYAGFQGQGVPGSSGGIQPPLELTAE